MKKLLASLALGVGALAALPAAAMPVISFTPSSQHVNVGETVMIDVSISGLGAEILSAFDLNFMYSSAVLSFGLVDSSSVQAQLGGGYGTPPLWFESLVNGDLEFQADALPNDDDTIAANQADSFLLFHFELTGAADGVTIFGLGPDPDFERNFVGRRFETLEMQIGNACVAVGTGQCNVPEPSSYALVGLALAAGCLPSWRRRRTTARV